MSFEPIGPSEVAAFLPECRAFADSALQAVAPSSAMFGAVLPSFLAAVFLSTPRLRSLWAFRILFFALVATLGKGLLEMQVGLSSREGGARKADASAILDGNTAVQTDSIRWTSCLEGLR